MNRTYLTQDEIAALVAPIPATEKEDVWSASFLIAAGVSMLFLLPLQGAYMSNPHLSAWWILLAVIPGLAAGGGYQRWKRPRVRRGRAARIVQLEADLGLLNQLGGDRAVLQLAQPYRNIWNDKPYYSTFSVLPALQNLRQQLDDEQLSALVDLCVTDQQWGVLTTLSNAIDRMPAEKTAAQQETVRTAVASILEHGWSSIARTTLDQLLARDGAPVAA